MNPLLVEVFRQLELALAAAWTRCGRGRIPSRKKGWTAYMREYSRRKYGRTYLALNQKGLSLKTRVQIARSRGATYREATRKYYRERAVREEAAQSTIRHLLQRVWELSGGVPLPRPYQRLVERAEYRLTAPERNRRRIEKIKATKRRQREARRNEAEEK